MKHMWSEEEINKAPKVLDSLVDSAGNPRFIEGDGVPATLTGFTSTYCKWSLSGSHLMLVLAGTFANASSISSNAIIASFNVPNFILNKIVAVFGTVIETKSIPAYASDWSSQNITFIFRKDSGLKFGIGNNVTFTAERSFRVQFDLLIDTE